MKTFSHRHAGARGGYILMEVMLAVAIFALAGVSLMILLSESISAGTRVQRETRIVWNLESRLNEARLGQLVAGSGTSVPDADGVVYVTDVDVLNLKNQKEQSLAGLYDLKVTAHWKEENLARDMEARTYVYRP
ncbi:MAG TPA: hypothetical protein VG733_07975 [Chthoniobacteraceae bacterium]|nr:hypothetical protein [Chthoniobacteraceae bacterium]